MKKALALILALTMVFALAACGGSTKAMSHADYAAADMESEVTVETYVQDKQSWWDNKATLYAQSEDGAYFIYNAAVSQADYDKLTPGTKIQVTGHKTEWSGEVEIADATIKILKGSWEAPVTDVTDLLGSEALIEHQNEKVSFSGLTVEPMDDGTSAFYYSWDNSGQEGTDSDLYFNASKDGVTYSFVVEYYLRNESSDVYNAVRNLQVGDTVDLEGFLYWYNGAQPHITSVTVK